MENRKEIKILMLQKNLTWTGLAKEAGITTITMMSFVNGKFKSKRLENFISEKLGIDFVTISEAWKKVS